MPKASSSIIERISGAVGLALTIAAQVDRLLPEAGWLPALLPLLTAACLLAAALYVAYAKPQPRYSANFRRVCKGLAAALIVLVAVRVWSFMPNAVTRERNVAGFVCRSGSGEPLAGATVEVLDRLGGVVSARNEPADDRGFFFADLKPWALAPHSLRIQGRCGAATVPLGAASGAGQCSAGLSRAPEALQESRRWELACTEGK